MSEGSAVNTAFGPAPSVALVDLGRPTATGATRRLRSLCEVLAHMGCRPTVVSAFGAHRSRASDVAQQVPAVIRGRAVPESLGWSARLVRDSLDQMSPDIVICITARAFHPDLLGPWRTFIDFVDRMSVNYEERSHLTHRFDERALYTTLARRHRMFEQALPDGINGAFAAGHLDSLSLGVPWWPITADPMSVTPAETADVHDLGFVGTLDYLPNVAAVRTIARLWPGLIEHRPTLTLLIAGSRPTPEVRSIASRFGWTLEADFEDLGQILGRMRVSVAPLDSATGIQIKVLDAGAAGLPQIVSPVVASGLDADFPFLVASSDHDWETAVLSLVGYPEEARRLGNSTREHVVRNFATEPVSRTAIQILGL